MAEHRLAWRAVQTLFAKLTGLVAPARIERGGGATNDVLWRVLGHVRHIICVIASEAKQCMTTLMGWILSSPSLSSGARSRDPLAPRNDGKESPRPAHAG